jgi:hypothetical protein
MKIYDEVIRGIEYSRNLAELDIVKRMLSNAQEDLTKEDYQELKQLITIKKEEEWK